MDTADIAHDGLGASGAEGEDGLIDSSLVPGDVGMDELDGVKVFIGEFAD